MEITTQHPESQRVGSWIEVVEGFLFDRIALERTDISPWDSQHTILIKTNFTNPSPPITDQASVRTSVAAKGITRESLVELALSSH
jgi:hypothetical protein